jgi:uncharacterized membrane protein YcfT
MAGGRLVWLDVARGGAIILVVFHHAILLLSKQDLAHSVYIDIDFALKQMRMPLFFLASGIATSFVIDLPRREFFARKLLPIAWIFIFWSLVLGVAFEGIASAPIWSERGILGYLAEVLHDPNYGMWFVLALGGMCLVAMLVRDLPPAIVLIAALAMTIHNDLSLYPRHFPVYPDWMVHNFLNYSLFFFFGLSGSRIIQRHTFTRTQVLALLASATVLFAVLNYIGHHSARIFEMTQTLRALSGATIGCAVAILLSRLDKIGDLFSWFGRRSLGVFVGHGLFLIPLVQLLLGFRDMIPTWAGAFLPILLTSASVAGAILLFESLTRLRLQWLYVLPPQVGRAIVGQTPAVPAR